MGEIYMSDFYLALQRGLIFVAIIYEPFVCLWYNRKSLIFVVKRNLPIPGYSPNDIGMSFTLLAIPYIYRLGYRRFFIKQLKTLLDGLEKGVIYTTKTHNIISRQLEHQARYGKIEIIKNKETEKDRFIFLEKLQLLNFKNFFERKKEIEIVFRVIA
jgi:hypothetical protein